MERIWTAVNTTVIKLRIIAERGKKRKVVASAGQQPSIPLGTFQPGRRSEDFLGAYNLIMAAEDITPE